MVDGKTSFRVGDTIEVQFRNNFGHPIFVFQSSGAAPLFRLQKWDGREWRAAPTGRGGFSGNMAVSYRELQPGGVLQTRFQPGRLAANGVRVEGLYRYVLTYYTNPTRDRRIIATSPEFVVLE